MSKMIFTIVTVAKHPSGQHSTNTYQVSARTRYEAIDQVIDSIHSYGLTVVSRNILDTKDTTKGKP